MINTIIGELYSTFSENELQKLDIYLSTSNWQYSDTVMRCHNSFMQARLEGSIALLDKQIIFRHVYEDEAYNDSKLRFLFNRVTEAIRDFVIHSKDRVGNIFTEKVWIDFLLDKKVRKSIQYNIDKRDINTSVEYKFLQQFFKSQEYNINTFKFSKDVKKQFQSITDLMLSAELFSDLVFIKNYCSLISFTNVYRGLPVDLPVNKLEEIKAKKWDTTYTEFLVYQDLLDLYINKSTESFQKLKEDFLSTLNQWNDEEKNNFLVSLLNYSTSQINAGKVEFIDEQYQLYELIESKNLFQITNFINTNRINNVIYTFLRKQQYQKANDFIKKYVPLLPEELRDSCSYFNFARVHYETKNYKQSLRELLKVDFSHDPGYSLNSKLLLLKNYFELKETDSFESLCLSFKEFIRKNKVISDLNKVYLLSFIKFTKKMYEATPAKMKKLKKELELATQIAEKAWLLEKCNQGR